MSWQTWYLVLHSNLPAAFYGFVFFATMCSYNFHWWLTPTSNNSTQRVAWAAQYKGWHYGFYLYGLAGTFVSFLFISAHWLAISFGALVTFLYSAPKLPQPVFRSLRKVAIGKTLFLSIVWTYVTTILPVFIANESFNGEIALFSISRFGLIYAICILFDYRDREDDRREGIRSMITYFEEEGINILFTISILIFAGASLGLYGYNYSLAKSIILLLPGVLVACLYRYAKKNFSDYLYYLILDGMMMLSGLLMLILKV
jgi:4-hydroxybenzoate polyprenyltransferase